MFQLTSDAARLVRTLVAGAALPKEGGLRISTGAARPGLSMGTAAACEIGDAVVTQHGATVFLSPPAARELSNATLRAEISAERSVFFLDR